MIRIPGVNMFKKCLVYGIVLIFPGFLQAQLTITGKVVEMGRDYPVPYVQVKLCETAFSSMTNGRGEFTMYIPGERSKDLLCFSALGYQDHVFPLSTLSDSSYLFIELEVAESLLRQEALQVESSDLNLKKFVKQAIHRIYRNYPLEPFEYIGHYQYIIRDENGKSWGSYESALRIYEKGYQYSDLRDSQIEILELRNLMGEDFASRLNMFNNNFELQSIPDYNLWNSGGNGFVAMKYNDPIRNPDEELFAFIFKFRDEFISNHSFFLKDIFLWKGLTIYQIGLKYHDTPRSKTEPTFDPKFNLVQGDIFIEEENFAIIRFTYENYGAVDGIKRYHIDVSYQPYEEKWYPFRMEFDNLLTVNDSTQPPFFLDKIKWRKGNDYLILEFSEVLSENFPTRSDLVGVVLAGVDVEVNSVKRYSEKELIVYIPDFDFKIRRYETRADQSGESQLLSTLLGNQTLRLSISEEVSDIYGNGFGLTPKTFLYQNRRFFVNDIEAQEPERIPVDAQMDKFRPFHEWKDEVVPGFWDTFNYVR